MIPSITVLPLPLTILFIKDIPRSDDTFFTLLAGIDIQKVGKDHERSRSTDVPLGFVLLQRTRNRDVEEDGPGHTSFSPHFEIQMTNTRIQTSTHEKVVEEVTRHTVMLAHDTGDHIHQGGHGETPDDGHGHDATKVFGNQSKAEDTRVMEDGRQEESEVPIGQTVT